MRIVTPASYRAEMTKRYPGAARRYPGASWLDPPECSNCGEAAAALVELATWESGMGDEEFYHLCATCLQAALDAVKAAGG